MRRQWWCKTGETGGTGDGGGGQKRCKTYPFDAIVTIGTFGGGGRVAGCVGGGREGSQADDVARAVRSAGS